ncbi:hypothetical protein [Vibrio marisflavi]|uniref:MSHA biogenesis protein MshF n=1 Tax=Vibrio marisflavi CECT 7928 TaxID=634439 RepID=A0ABN8E6X5_9VIBR|nr:hypothetical protein [Vibrio marisflavi]CAH0541578.1 hypothetical protein VMF7928_03641 [Vibrio marisflavi CECT 7928]
MLFRDNYLSSVRYFRFALWLLVVSAVVAGFLSFWQNIDGRVGNTSLVIAKKLISDRANYYRQQWMLQGQPSSYAYEGKTLYFHRSGWILPLRSRDMPDCSVWLQQLYPEAFGKEQMALEVSDSRFDEQYWCKYRWLQGGEDIHILLTNEKFEVE